MGKTKLVHFGTTMELRQDQSSIEKILPTILSDMAKHFLAKGLKFDFGIEWGESDTDNHFYRYEVDRDVNIEVELSNLLSSLREQGIDAKLIKTEKTGSYEKYLLGRRM